MSADWSHVLVSLALQHLWQCAFLFALAWVVLRLCKRMGAQARGSILLCVMVLAAVLPLAVFLPADHAVPIITATPSVAGAGVATTAHPVQIAPIQASADDSQPMTFGQGMVRGLLGLWLLGCLIALQRLIARTRAARNLRAASVRLSMTGRNLPRSLPISAEVRLSDHIDSPMVVGLRSPCILLPKGLLDELTDAALAHLLRHELAHIRRGDLWASLLEGVCLAVYWWNPLLWLLRARLVLTREMACDEQAAEQCGDATDYANTLLASAWRLVLPRYPRRLLAVGIFDTRAALTQRIEGLLNMHDTHRVFATRHALVACVGLIVAGTSLTLMATPRFGPAWPVADANVTAHAGDGRLLIDAVEAGRPELIRNLVKGGADINAVARGDGTALIVAAKRGDMTMVKVLLALGAKVDRPSRGDGNPLIAAAAFGHLDVARVLVAGGANVNASVVSDETPLINAARNGHMAIVKYLVEQGADVNLGMLADGSGPWRSPLNQAATGAIRDYLVSKGAVEHTQ